MPFLWGELFSFAYCILMDPAAVQFTAAERCYTTTNRKDKTMKQRRLELVNGTCRECWFRGVDCPKNEKGQLECYKSRGESLYRCFKLVPVEQQS